MDFESGFVLNYQYGFILKERLILMIHNLFYMSLPLFFLYLLIYVIFFIGSH